MTDFFNQIGETSIVKGERDPDCSRGPSGTLGKIRKTRPRAGGV